jgi:ABC-2 type transport system ATP-binding protein
MQIDIEYLTKSYQSLQVIDIKALSIPQGQAFGLVGNNGAGKTTLFRLILDLVKTDSGSIISGGVDVSESESWKFHTGSYLGEEFLIPFLTAEEYFHFIGRTYQLDDATVEERYRDYESFFSGEVLGQQKFIRDFSTGNKRKIGIVAALIVEPEVLILDEPFANLDPTSQQRLVDILVNLKGDRSPTLLISSHDLSNVTSVCDRIAVLELGDIVMDVDTGADTLDKLESYFFN